VTNENDDLIADSHRILNMWQNYFSRLLTVHDISDVRQIAVHTDEPLVPPPRPFEIEVAIAKLKKRKSQGSEKILAELIQAGGETLQKARLIILSQHKVHYEKPHRTLEHTCSVHMCALTMWCTTFSSFIKC
jgi:hypothetical protein